MFNPLPNNGDGTFAFPSQCVMLKFNGAWPLKRSKLSQSLVDRLYLFWAYALIVLVALTCYAQASFLFAAWGDILTVTECGCTVFMGIHNLLRLIHLSYSRQALKKLLDDFVQNIWISKSTHERIANQCAREMIVLRYISLLQFILILLYITLPLFELFTIADGANKPYPYNMLFPYDANKTLAYAITYFLTSLAGFGVVTNLFSEDSLFAFFTTHTCARLRLIQENISHLMQTGQQVLVGKNPDLIKNEHSITVVQYEYRRQLIKIIQKHNILISFFEDLHSFCSPILLINYIISSLLICMVGLQIVAVELTVADFLKLFVYIVSALSQLLVLCWKGNDLIVTSLHTSEKFYSCNWQGKSNGKISFELSKLFGETSPPHDIPANVEFMKNIKFAISRSQKPLTLIAMKFSALALPTFARIFSQTISYFTLLQSLVERSE